MRNYLTFGGRDSRDFGVYISGQGTFSAPEKAYTFYSIPGRSGALIGNERRLENIEVSYECFIYSNFSQNIADFRSYLLSLDGYQELTDSYHPDEFRLACYVGPFEPTVTTKNDAGSFTLTFNCKPQRYLYSGQTRYFWTPNGHQTLTGYSITAEAAFLDPSVLQGYFTVINGVNQTANGSLYVNGTKVSSFGPIASAGNPSEWVVDWIAGTGQITSHSVRAKSDSSWTRTNATTYYLSAANYSGFTVPRNGTYVFYPDTDYSAIFDGQPTFSSGKLIFTTKASYGSLSAFTTALSTAYGSKVIAYCSLSLTTAETFSFTPYTLPTSGTVVIEQLFSKSLVSVEYTQSDGMANPTPFPSEPLIRVTGSGSFDMDGVTVTITTPGSYTDIDCELMDCYEGSTNRNANVTFSTYDFPKLQPGQNAITINTGITLIEIWPRWWRV